MASTFTPNIQLEEPGRGDQVGVWDTPVNANMTVVDKVVGAVQGISLNNSNVVLSAAQFQSSFLQFNSTLTGSVTITFPTSFIKPYTIFNNCTGSSAFTITLQTTSGGFAICAPPGEVTDVVNDGSNLRYKNLGRIGGYWDYAGSSVPAWVSGCTVPPYLNCTGASFSSVTYPTLAMILGGTTLPDSQARYRLTLNQGSGTPISSAINGSFTASSVGVLGGTQATTLSSLHLPKLVDPGHTHVTNAINFGGGTAVLSGGPGGQTATINSATTGITYGSSSQIVVSGVPPSYVGGITMIRAA